MKRCDALCLLNSVPRSILALLLVVLISGCGSGSSSGGPSGVASETLPFGTSTKNVQLTAGVPKQFKFTYAFPGDITSRGDYSINVTKTLENITLSSSPVFRIIKTLSNKPDRWFDLRDIDRCFDVSEQEVHNVDL